MNLRLGSAIDDALRLRYSGFNPLDDPERYWANVYRTVDGGYAQQVKPRIQQGILLTGVGGMGKTTAAARLLGRYPSTVLHERFRKANIEPNQITYLYLTTPTDGSIRDLCMQGFEAIDALIGTPYANLFRTLRNPGDAMQRFTFVARKHHLGLLVIDEVQFLRVTGYGQERVLNYLTRFTDSTGCPILFIGTPHARTVLSGTLRQGRRTVEGGDFDYRPHANGQEWTFFLSHLWQHQCTAKPQELTEEISNLIHELTQGVTALAINLFLEAQALAIDYGTEQLTPALFHEAADNTLRLTARHLALLRKARKGGLTEKEAADLDTAHFETRESAKAKASDAAADEAESDLRAIQRAAQSEGSSVYAVLKREGKTAHSKAGEQTDSA